MLIEILCESCLSVVKAKDSQIGKTLPCPKCKSPILVKERTPMPPPPPEKEVDWEAKSIPKTKYTPKSYLIVSLTQFVMALVGLAFLGVGFFFLLNPITIVFSPAVFGLGFAFLFAVVLVDVLVDISRSLDRLVSREN